MNTERRFDTSGLPQRRRARPLTAANRNAILEGAADVFGATPFDEVLVDQIARRAGVGKGTLYRYFSSKEDLYIGMKVAGLPRLQERVEQAVAAAKTPEEKVRMMAREMVAYFWQETLFIALVPKNPGEERKSEPVWQKERDAFRARLAKILSEGEAAGVFRKVDRLRAAVFFFAGLLRAAILNRRPEDTPEGVGDEITDFFIRGVAAR